MDRVKNSSGLGLAALPATLAVMLVVLAFGEAHAAKKKVVILGIHGPRGGQATRLVARALAGRFRLVSRGRFVRAAREQGVSINQAPGRALAARVLRVAGLVSGSITRVGRRWVLRVVVFSGHSGRRVGGKAFPLRGTRLDPTTARRVAAGIAMAMGRARAGPPMRGVTSVRVKRRPRRQRRRRVASRVPVVPRPQPQPPPPPPEPQPEPPPSTFDDGSEVDSTPPDDNPPVLEDRNFAARGTGDDDLGFEVNDRGNAAANQTTDDGGVPEYEGSSSGGDDDDDAEAQVSKGTEERQPWEKIFELSFGMMAMTRTFDIHNPIKPANPEGHSNYRSGVVPAIVLDGAVYPLSYFNRGPLANLGLVVHYYRVLGLKSQQAQMVEPADTTLHVVEVGMRYRWNILSRLSSPTLKAGVDFGRLGFKIHDESGKIKLPNVAYVYLKLALVGLEVPFYTKRDFMIGGMASFDYLLIFSSGDIERTDSRSYGRSSTGGIDAGAGLYGSYAGFFVKLTGFYRRIFYDFDNTCLGVTDCLGAGGALDVYLGGSVSAGYSY